MSSTLRDEPGHLRRPLRLFLSALLWLSAGAFGLWFGSTAFHSSRTGKDLSGETELDQAKPGPTRSAEKLTYPDLNAPIPRLRDPFEPAPTIQTPAPKKQPASFGPQSLLAQGQRLLVDVDMHRLMANPCLAGLEHLFHDRVVEPAIQRLGLELGEADRFTVSLSYSSDLDWYSDPILRFFVRFRRYVHAPLCGVAQVRASKYQILKRLYRRGPLTAATILGRRVFYSSSAMVAILPEPGYLVLCKGDDIIKNMKLWPKQSPWPKARPLPAHEVLTAKLTAGAGKERTRAELTLMDDGTSLGVRVHLTGARHRVWRSRLRRAFRTLVQSSWARRTGLSWQVDAARWRVSPDDSTVRFTLERTCNRLRGYIQDVTR